MTRKWEISRRDALKYLAISIGLPMLEAMLPSFAFAAPAVRKRFIGIYFPNGAYMPGAADGDWAWSGALAPLEAAGHRSNIMVVRGLKGITGTTGVRDIHWDGTGGFLSCKLPVTGNPATVICGKSIDQYLADLAPMPLRSLALGLREGTFLPDTHAPVISLRYTHVISWKADDQPISNINSPRDAFSRVFAAGGQANQTAAQIQYLLGKKKSILDGALEQIRDLQSKVGTDDRNRLQRYFDGIREIELEIGASPPTCAVGPVESIVSGSGFQDHFRSMHKIIVKAFECDLTRAVTLMYDTGIAQETVHPGMAHAHHQSAHHGGNPEMIASIKQINRIQTGLLADLITRLKAVPGLLQDTLIAYGSDMSDGNVHSGANIPFLIAGAGSDFRFGQEIGSAAQPRRLSDAYMELFPQLGLGAISSFGESDNLSTGVPLGLRAS